MTYNVFGGTLNLTQSVSQSALGNNVDIKMGKDLVDAEYFTTAVVGGW